LVKGRTVYGGGGITPDIYIPLDTSMFNPFVNEIFGLSLIQSFAYDYFNAHNAEFTNINLLLILKIILFLTTIYMLNS
jgi:carboxyl-terminal processing protease